MLAEHREAIGVLSTNLKAASGTRLSKAVGIRVLPGCPEADEVFFRKVKLDENGPAEVGNYLSPDGLSYYTGPTRDILLAAIMKFRIYLWTKDPYPKARVLSNLSSDCFTHGCEAVLGKKAKSTSEDTRLCVLTQS